MRGMRSCMAPTRSNAKAMQCDPPCDHLTMSPRRPAPPRPNYFLALRMSHTPSVVAAVQAVHSALVEAEPGLRPALEEGVKGHLTLLVMALMSEDDMTGVCGRGGRRGGRGEKAGPVWGGRSWCSPGRGGMGLGWLLASYYHIDTYLMI